MPKKYGHMSDAQYQERLRGIEKRRERQLDDDLRSLMGEPWGRRVAYYLIFELGRLEALSFEPSVKDGVAAAQHTARNEGMREVASELLTKVQDLAPVPYLAMIEEQVRQRQADLAEKRPPAEEAYD